MEQPHPRKRSETDVQCKQERRQREQPDATGQRIWGSKRDSNDGVANGLEYRRRDYVSQNFHGEMLSRATAADNLFR
jgi:hypothetical protein